MKTNIVITIGDWDGGNNGQYPLLLEYDSSNSEKPLSPSEDLGHGYGGNNFLLETFNKHNQPESMWLAYD